MGDPVHRGILEQALLRSSDGVILLGSDGRILLWNCWMVSRSRIEESDAIGRLLGDLFPGLRMGRLTMSVDNALRRGQSSLISHSINPFLLPLYPRGDTEQVQRLPHGICVSPLHSGNNERYCLIEISDLQAAHQRENLLRQQGRELKELAVLHERQEEQARAIIENISDALVTIDSGNRVTDLNNVAHRLFQRSDQQILGREVGLLFTDFAAIESDDGEQDHPVLVDGIRGNGERFPAEVGVSHVNSSDRSARVLIVRDLTERLQAEESLFREKEFAQITLQSIHEAVITTDELGRINSANTAACKLLRKEHDRVIDRPLLDLLTFSGIDYRRAARKGLHEALKQGLGSELPGLPELRFEDGETIFINGRINALRGRSGGIVGAVVVVQDVTVEKRMQEILSFQATHDELTSLINRREFERQLTELLETRVPQINNILLYLDLDQFKLINDNCGHDAGDQMLRQLTGLLRTRLRHTDVLARLGGDEFAALLPHCSLEIGQRIAEELRETVRDFRFNWEGRNFAVGVSIGMVNIDSSMDNVATVMAAADSACYIAKENGRDQVVVYKADGNEEQRRRDEMSQAARIREALEYNRFALFCQPIVPVDTRRNQGWGVEVLVRMLDDDDRPVPPMAFIPAAERYNLMSHVDRWVLDALCEQWRENRSLFERLYKIAVNLSGQSVANDEFLQYVIDRVESCELPWDLLCFEITETAAVASIEKAQIFMRELSAKGCRFALDDFGSGLSSFTYLKHLPVDYLKIDGAFVKDMLEDQIDAAMVRSISDIGRSMGLKTIAEFVENTDVVDALRQAHVDYAQGWGICKPMPLNQLPGFTPRDYPENNLNLRTV